MTTEADELAVLIGQKFIERRDVKAVQGNNGAYRPVTANGKADGDRLKFTVGDLRAHVAGTKTFGHYLVSPEGNCRVFCFDIDLRKSGRMAGREIEPREAWHKLGTQVRELLTVQLRCTAEALAIRTHLLLDIPIAISYSGSKGLHVYGFCGSTPASDVRAAAMEVLDDFGSYRYERGHHLDDNAPNIEIEVFPKQDSLDGKDLGNLLRLPMGINRKHGCVGFFVDPRYGYNQLIPLDPRAALDSDFFAQWAK